MNSKSRRMLDDPRSESLVTNFAGQWLYLAEPGDAEARSRCVSPSSTRACAGPSRSETELFFESVLRENRSVLELLDANYTFLNQRLAEHYGIPNIYGSQFRRVTSDRSESRRACWGRAAF